MVAVATSHKVREAHHPAETRAAAAPQVVGAQVVEAITKAAEARSRRRGVNPGAVVPLRLVPLPNR